MPPARGYRGRKRKLRPRSVEPPSASEGPPPSRWWQDTIGLIGALAWGIGGVFAAIVIAKLLGAVGRVLAGK